MGSCHQVYLHFYSANLCLHFSGSRYYENEMRREHQVNLRIAEQSKKMESLDDGKIKLGEREVLNNFLEIYLGYYNGHIGRVTSVSV